MSQPCADTSFPYKPLADHLLPLLGDTWSMKDIADYLQVSPPAVSQWFSGKCRPRPSRLGYFAGMLNLGEEDLENLTALAGYSDYQHRAALEAYRNWPSVHEKRRLARSARRKFTEWALGQFRQNEELRQALEMENPELYEAVQEAFG